ncbi:MAG: lipopolysaccharide transport periplasmic protein LptA [Gammaproteobacteria bacterium]|nr:lipopolysaccharide transport periplasmic protein LptA [Gammaproteobacteria bacterium]
MNSIKLILLFYLCITNIAHALDSDKNQPISLNADSADINDLKGISIFTGNVILTQGSLTLKANKLTAIYDKSRKIHKIIAETDKNSNTPASIKQLPEGKNEYIQAQANTINYLIKNGKIRLLGKASFWQENSVFRGEIIDYDIDKAMLKAIGNPIGKQGTTEKERVHVTFDPKIAN